MGDYQEFKENPSWKKWMEESDLDVDMSSINDYIHDRIQEAFSLHGSSIEEKGKENNGGTRLKKDQGKLEYRLFEIIGCMIVQISLPKDVDLKEMKLGIEHRELAVLKGEELLEVILLPNRGLENKCKALYLNQMIEVRIPLDPHRDYTEIPIIPV